MTVGILLRRFLSFIGIGRINYEHTASNEHDTAVPKPTTAIAKDGNTTGTLKQPSERGTVPVRQWESDTGTDSAGQ